MIRLGILNKECNLKNIVNHIKTLKEDIEQNMSHILIKQELRSEEKCQKQFAELIATTASGDGWANDLDMQRLLKNEISNVEFQQIVKNNQKALIEKIESFDSTAVTCKDLDKILKFIETR